LGGEADRLEERAKVKQSAKSFPGPHLTLPSVLRLTATSGSVKH
jgi:hypothetical protein